MEKFTCHVGVELHAYVGLAVASALLNVYDCIIFQNIDCHRVRLDHGCSVVMKPFTEHVNFHLLRDPFWIMATLCYVLHKCWQSVFPDSGWMDQYWSDIWMLPCALPVILSLYSAFGLRKPGALPSVAEILSHGVLWGLMAEFLGPMLFAHSVGDPWDLVAYAVGGFFIFARWHYSEIKLFYYCAQDSTS